MRYLSHVALLVVFLLSLSAFAQNPTISIEEDCSVYVVEQAFTDPSISCAQSDEEKTDLEYPVKIFLGGLSTYQTQHEMRPISYWNLAVEFHPFWEKLETKLSVDNPVLGEGFPSTVIQPARTAYHLSVAVQNIKIGNVDGIRIAIFHVSDHMTEELTPFKNNEFKPAYDGGFADILSVQKTFKSNTKVEVGYMDSLSNYNIVRYFDIPGYLIAEVGSEGFLVRADQQIRLNVNQAPPPFGKILNGQYEINLGASYIWDIQGQAMDISFQTANTRSTSWIYPDGDLIVGYADISKMFQIGNTYGRIHLTSAGQIPLENLDRNTSFAKDENEFHFYRATGSGYVTLGLEFLPWARTR